MSTDGRRLVVRRSAWRMWLLAIASIPLLVVGLDYLGERRIFDAVIRLVYGLADDAPQPEAREAIWAVVFLLAGAGLALWGLKELLAPSTVVAADEEGVRLKIAGPGRRPVAIPWELVDDVRAHTILDDGEPLPVLVIVHRPEARLPDDPWGARRLDARTLVVLASDWDRSLPDVAARLRRYREEALVSKVRPSG